MTFSFYVYSAQEHGLDLNSCRPKHLLLSKQISMEIKFITQPHSEQLGEILFEKITRKPRINSLTIVSAFSSLKTIFRFKEIVDMKQCEMRFVLGIDLGGTSKQVLAEIASWPAEVFIFKNSNPSVTFHPKIYLIEKKNSTFLAIGSHNCTDGGLFNNYECSTFFTYKLPEDQKDLESAKQSLSYFLDPQEPMAKKLDSQYLEYLKSRSKLH